MSSYSDQEWHSLLEFISRFTKLLPQDGSVLPLTQLRAQTHNVLEQIKPTTSRVVKYVQRLLRLKPHCPQKWGSILIAQFRSQKKKKTAQQFYKSTLLTKVLYFWLSAAKPPVLRSLQESPRNKLISQAEVGPRKAITTQTSNYQTLSQQELHISNKPSISTAVGHHSFANLSVPSIPQKPSQLQGQGLVLTLGASSQLGEPMERKFTTLPLSPTQVHTFSPQRAFAAVRSLNSMRFSAKSITKGNQFGSFGAQYIDGYLDAVKLREKNLKKKALLALLIHTSRHRTARFIANQHRMLQFKSVFESWRNRTAGRLCLEKHLLIALDFWAYNVKRRFMQSWVSYINQTRQTRLRYLRPSCFRTLSLLIENSGAVRPGLTRAAQIAYFIGARTVRLSMLGRVFKVLRRDYETMRFKRGNYALNIVTGCFFRWKQYSKKEGSLRKRLEKFSRLKQKYSLISLFGVIKKYAVSRILKNNEDYEKIQRVFRIRQRIQLRKWNNLTHEAARQHKLLGGILISRSRALKSAIFSELKISSIINHQKRVQKESAIRYSLFQVKKRNFRKLSQSVEKSKRLRKCSLQIEKRRNAVLKHQYMKEWWLAMDWKIKLEQFLNTRRAKELLKLLRLYKEQRQKYNQLKHTGYRFEKLKRGARYLKALRQGVSRCKTSKRNLVKYFTRKVKDNKRRAFSAWSRKVRRGDSMSEILLGLAHFRAQLKKKTAFFELYRRASLMLGCEEIEKQRNLQRRQVLFSGWKQFSQAQIKNQQAFGRIQLLHRQHQICRFFFLMKKRAKTRENVVHSYRKIIRAKVLSKGIAKLKRKCEWSRASRQSKIRIKVYFLTKVLSRYFRFWLRHHQMPEFSLNRKAQQCRKRTLLRKYLGGFLKLTVLKRNRSILRMLKAQRLKQEIYSVWKRKTQKRKVMALRTEEVRRVRLKTLVETWRGFVDHQKAIFHFMDKIIQKRNSRLLSVGFASLQKDLGIRYECRRRLEEFKKLKKLEKKDQMFETWVRFVTKEASLRAKLEVVKVAQHKRQERLWFQKWRECYTQNMLIKECSFGKFVETLRRCFVEWKVIAISKRARSIMKKEATGIYHSSLKRQAWNALRDYLNLKLQSHFKAKMGEAHYISNILKKCIDQLYLYAQHKINKSINLNEACRHFMIRLTERSLRLWKRRTQLFKVKRTGPLPLMRKHFARFRQGIDELKSTHEIQEKLNQKGEELFTEKAQRGALLQLKNNAAVQKIVKRELRVVDKFRTKLWLEKLKEAASTHKHLKALIQDTHMMSQDKENVSLKDSFFFKS